MSLKDQVWTALVVEVPAEAVEAVSATVFDRGCLGIEELETGEHTIVRAYFEQGAHESAQIVLERDYEVSIERVPYGDWAEGWKKHFVPTRVGERIIIRPSWEEVTPEPGDIVITIDPGIAFGTGTHETTRMCLEALERWVSPGARVLDVGCGTAILSIAAVRLGAEVPVIAIDVDDDAVVSARENLERNAVLDHVEVSTTPLREVRGTFDVVVANILADKLVAMADALIAHVAIGGALVLSGVSLVQRDEVVRAFALPVLEEQAVDPWMLLTFQRTE